MPNIRKPECDTRTYSAFELPNGLRVIVASDPDKSVAAAAALCVLAGSLHEPKEIPGLAHLCEHMVLHGTLQPWGTTFSEHIKAHAGQHNAVTTMLQTCFAFEIQSDKLDSALRLFCRFFVSPQFCRSLQHQELQAIDSEHSMNAQSDFRRQWAVLLQDANPRHPYHWASGCSKSLLHGAAAAKCDLHEAMEKFHESTYKASRMTLAVVGPQPTEKLEALVRACFTSVPSEPQGRTERSTLIGDQVSREPAFLSEDFCGQVFVSPLKDLQQLKLSWSLPWQISRWRSKPSAYATYLLGQEGPGSLLAALKARNLAQHLSIACYDYHGAVSTLELSVDLTDTNDQTVLEVGELVFAFISMIRSLGIQGWVLKEYTHLQKLNYNFQFDTATYNLVQDLACNLHYYPVEEVLAADSLLYDQDASASMDILNLMTVDNARLSLLSKSLESICASCEPWYEAKFMKFQSIKGTWKARWQELESGSWHSIVEKSGLGFPHRNSFLPADFALRSPPPLAAAREMEVPQDWCRAWLRPTSANHQPKVAASFCFRSFELSTPENIALAHILCKCVEQSFRAEAFEARMAGAMYKLDVVDHCFLLQFLGFRDKMHLLAGAAASSLFVAMRAIPRDCFLQAKMQQERIFKNASSGQAYSQALAALEDLLLQRPSASDLLKATQQLHQESAGSLPEKFFGPSACLVEALIIGNVNEADARQLLEAVIGPMAKLRKFNPGQVPVEVPAKAELLIPRSLGRTILKIDGQAAQDINNCAVECLCNIAAATPQHEALAAVLVSIWKPLFFNELRTQQQLGYVVSCFMRIRVTHVSLIFVVQTDRLPEVALKSIDKFFSHAFTHIICTVTERQFREQCEGIARQLEESPRNLWDAMSRDWLPIEERTFSFDACLRQVAMLRACTLNQLRAFVKQEVQPSPRLAVLLRSPKAAWQRASQDWGDARVLTKWGLSSFKAGLQPSFANKVFGKAGQAASSSEGNAPVADAIAIDEDEECRVQ
ncbi:IDE [Symbiodinium sp. KB8]|nr:IDE [Symbiodinium sp. KB8]